jgi:hypothetical protein
MKALCLSIDNWTKSFEGLRPIAELTRSAFGALFGIKGGDLVSSSSSFGICSK